GPKILFELSQVETGRAAQDLRHGVRAKVGHGIRTLLCLRATRAKSQYKVGLNPERAPGEAQPDPIARPCWASADEAGVSPIHALAHPVGREERSESRRCKTAGCHPPYRRDDDGRRRWASLC